MMHPTSTEPALDSVRLISASEFAELLNVSTRTLWRLLSAGKVLPPVRIGGSVRWRLRDVREWIDRGCPQVENAT